QILDESPAANSNLQVGDVIVEFNGHFVESNTHLPPIVGRTPVGHPVPVKVMREGRQVVVKVVIGELPGEDQLAEVRPDPLNSEKAEPLAVQRLGMHMSEVPKAIRKERTLGSGGVYLEQVESGSVADRFGLRRGDVISRVNYVVVEGVEHFLQLIERMPKHKGVPVYVVREKGPIFLAMRLP
ncbi:MAG TPA: PDZ domain-containing protein, partial [Gammaproteobacteria bacterium]|nr:PDZ domain-containing protein [Gammaproteobacteria bacterium]